MNTPLVSIIIPNWNGEHILADCLSSLKTQSFKNFEVVLVDNNSTDDSLKTALSVIPDIRIIALSQNYGFAKAINFGVKHSSAKYVVFLNNDTVVDIDWLKELVRVAQKNPGVSSVCSKLLNFYNQKIIDGVGVTIDEVGHGISRGWQQKDDGQFDTEEEIFGATGGAALFDREIFITVGMFDENYYMYYEEVDFAFRSQFLGYTSVFAPRAVVYHKHKATSQKRGSELVEYWQFRNMTQTIIRDFPTSLLVKNFLLLKIILVHFNTIFYQIKNGYFWAPFKADLWIIMHLVKLLQARAMIQDDKKVTDEYIEQFLLPKKITFWGFIA
jgi:GT2 family glycosyltransferase